MNRLNNNFVFLKQINVMHAPPLTGAPPSNLGGSQIMEAQSSPTPVHLIFSGGSGTSDKKIAVYLNTTEKTGQTGICKKTSLVCCPLRGETSWCYPVKPSLTHNLQKQHSLVLSGRVGDSDGVVALIVSLRPLYDKAAEVFPGLHPYTSFSVCDWLTHDIKAVKTCLTIRVYL